MTSCSQLVQNQYTVINLILQNNTAYFEGEMQKDSICFFIQYHLELSNFHCLLSNFHSSDLLC